MKLSRSARFFDDAGPRNWLSSGLGGRDAHVVRGFLARGEGAGC